MALRRINPTGETRTSRSRGLPDMLLNFKVFSGSLCLQSLRLLCHDVGTPLPRGMPCCSSFVSLARVDVDTATPGNWALTPPIW
jgi:hypothetical protein